MFPIEWVVLIVVVLAFALAILAGYDDKSVSVGIGSFFLLLLFPGSMIVIIAGLVVDVASNSTRVCYESDTQLSTLSNNSQMVGRFFLGSGTLDSHNVYTYMKKRADGGMEMGSVSAAESVLYDVPAGDAPHIVQTDYCSTWTRWDTFAYERTEYKIFVPADSVWQGYEIDVRN